MTRKEFLKRGCLYCLGLGLSSTAVETIFGQKAFAAKSDFSKAFPAMFYKKIDDSTVQCQLCPRGCTLSDGVRSFCRVREARGGELYTFAYGSVCSAHVDPIEKKPLFHFLPGSGAFSIATAGCNYRCKSCQNWQIAQIPPEDVNNRPMSPSEIADEALAARCRTIAYTYTEPVIFYEYMLATSKIARQRDIRNMCHSNGSFSPKALDGLTPYLDAANIDLKGFTQEFYEDYAAGYLDNVLGTLKTLKRDKVWLEITNLIIPTMNDDPAKIKEMCVWIYDNLGPDVPVHFSRFWPQYKLTGLYPTPVETLIKARETAMASGIRYSYIGNVPGHAGENTFCHNCQRIIIGRRGYTILENHVKEDGSCAFCSTKIPGVWS